MTMTMTTILSVSTLASRFASDSRQFLLNIDLCFGELWTLGHEMCIVTKKTEGLEGFSICSYVRLDADESVFFVHKLLKFLVRGEKGSYKTISQ